MKNKKSLSLMLFLATSFTITTLLAACGNFALIDTDQDVTHTPLSQTEGPDITVPPSAEKTISPTPFDPKPTISPTRREAAYTAFPILRGINLGNALEAPSPGVWGVTVTEEIVESIAFAGFNAIRLPVRFSAHTGGAPEYLIDSDFLLTVDEIINWGLDAGLTVVLDLHHFDAIMLNPVHEQDQFLAIWQQLAEYYQDMPAELYFEPLSEPSDNLDAALWNELVEKGVEVIRRTNPTRKILIDGINYSDIEALLMLNLPSDDHLIATFHFYEPFEFTHQGASWVAGSSYWLGSTWEGNPSEKQAIRQAFDSAVDWSNLHKIPLIMGEFGVIKIADPTSREKWIRFVVQEAERREISWFYWELCSDFGVYNCQDAVWDDVLLQGLIQ